MLQPREIVGRGLCPADALNFYIPFLEKIYDSACDAYSQTFPPPTYPNNRWMIEYSIKKSGVAITYSASPVIRTIPDGADSPTIYGGVLTVEQKGSLDLERTGKFMEKMQPHSLLAYRTDGDPNFQVFHHHGEKRIAQGQSLVEKLKLNPQDACEFLVVPGAVLWAYVDLTKK